MVYDLDMNIFALICQTLNGCKLSSTNKSNFYQLILKKIFLLTFLMRFPPELMNTNLNSSFYWCWEKEKFKGTSEWQTMQIRQCKECIVWYTMAPFKASSDQVWIRTPSFVYLKRFFFICGFTAKAFLAKKLQWRNYQN